MESALPLYKEIKRDLANAYHLPPSEKTALLFVFNPSHELVFADGGGNYTPPANVARMERELADFPLIYAGDDDFVLDMSTSVITDGKGDEICPEPDGRLIPFPWGWNKRVRQQFLKIGGGKWPVPSYEYVERLRMLANRSFAAEYISRLLCSVELAGWKDCLVGECMMFHKTVGLADFNEGEWIFKQPWSSSGRGNFTATTIDNVTKNRLAGFIGTQGGFLSDKFYHKTLDFALEFYVFSDSSVRFVGYSVFQAADKGTYGGNLVDSQENIKAVISEKIGNEALLDALTDAHVNMLRERLGGLYTGFVGIDMMVVEEHGKTMCHPCVEINLRMNMGVVAMAAYRRPFFFDEGGGGGSVVGDSRRSSTLTPSVVRRERGFHTCLNDRFISIRYS